VRSALLALLVLPVPVLAQPDLSGTWSLNAAKSHSSAALPTTRMLVITRAGNGYTVRQTDSAGTATFMIALGGVAPAADLGDGASNMRYTARASADTIVYVVDVTVDGQGLVGTQSGRLFLSDGGRVLTDLSELVSSGDAVEQRLVFDRKR
jgi:hypothetical protein